jgi:hypothetical protein
MTDDGLGDKGRDYDSSGSEMSSSDSDASDDYKDRMDTDNE